MKINILIAFLFVVLAAKAQQPTNANITSKTRKLSAIEYNKVKDLKLCTVTEFTNNDSVYELVKYDAKNIRKTAFKKNTNLKKIEIYGSKTLQLKSDGYIFYDMSIGFHNMYNTRGKVVKSINYDNGYKISIDNFIALIYKKTEIDITQKSPNVFDLARSFTTENKMPFYNIMLRAPDNLVRTIKVNANDGTIYKDVTQYLGD